MAYIGKSIESGTFSVLDTSGNTYNGSNTTFNLGTQVGSVAQLLVSHDGVLQKPGTDYSLASGGTQITFSTAPASGASIFIVEISGAVGGPLDADLNGTELILDADGDTSLHASTDDQIDVKIAGADDFQFTANTFTAQSGSTIAAQALTATTVVGSGAAQFATAGIITAKDLGVGLHIRTSDTSASVDGGADELVIENGSGDGGISILGGTSSSGSIAFGDSGDNNIGRIVYAHGDNKMRLVANAVNTAYFGSSEIVFNEDSNDQDFRVEGNGNANLLLADGGQDIVFVGKNNTTFSNPGIEMYAYGTMRITRDAANALDLNRTNADGFILGINNDGSFEGGITFSGGTVSYSAFCGSHWSRLADNSKPTILRGTVMESIASMCDWYQAKATDDDGNKIVENIFLPDGKSVGDAVTFTSDGKEYTGTYVKETNERLAMCKISDTEDSKSVYGVFNSWDDQDDGLDGDVNDMTVSSLGAYIVRIHKDETVAIGDYLQSKGDGTAKKQADDILRASTIAKVTSTEKTVTYDDGSYCVPCTLHCG